MAVIQFKRGSSQRWKELNPVLAVGEPGYDIDKGRLKIGDGITPWNDLLFQDEQAVVSRHDRFSFPSYGKTNTIYKDESAGTLYQWIVDEDNPSGGYEVLGTEGVLDITTINGGNANGTT
jgi:hypothetical protein